MKRLKDALSGATADRRVFKEKHYAALDADETPQEEEHIGLHDN